MRLSAAVLFASFFFACAAPEQEGVVTGTTAQPIIRGAASSADQNFVVELALTFGGQTYPACSATVVAKNLILTARHCVGELQSDGITVVDFPASEIKVYPGADAPQRIAAGAPAAARGMKLFTSGRAELVPDIALVLLDTPLATTPVAKIRLEGGAKKSELLDIVGFGIDENNADPDVRMQRKGVRVLDVGPLTTSFHEIYDGEFYFGEAACSGDSGGPALSATSHAVVGVASRVSNGKDRTEEDPSAFCVGAETEDVYTSLAPMKDVVLQAFEAAGAKPLLEDEPAPPPPSDAGKAAPASGDADDDAKAAPVARTTTTRSTSDGCTAAPAPRRGSPAALVAGALLLATASLRSARRRPRERRARR